MTTRCKHPGCLNLARNGRLCDYHRFARERARAAKDNQRRKARRRDARAKAILAAIKLLERNGYDVRLRRAEPEAFPS